METNYNKVSEIASAHLGKKAGDYSDFVNITTVRPDLLVGIPRELNRADHNITGDEFNGYDVWHGYEVSALNDNGVPISGMAKVKYSSKSPNIVESKSMKLFWNSFNMAKLGKTKTDVIQNIERIAATELSKVIGSPVDVKFHYYENSCYFDEYNDYQLLDNMISDDLVIDTYVDDASVLESRPDNSELVMKVRSANLRSNCRVTNQPDFGDVFIQMIGQDLPTYNSLMKYIVSFRKEQHFHEECVEMLFKTLHNRFNPEHLTVCALYTRRGGWDICPYRTTDPEDQINTPLINMHVSHTKTLRQ